MNRVYTAVTKQDDGWWIGWIEEVSGVNCQERTHEQLLETLKATLKEALKFNLVARASCPCVINKA
jgi:predicted RNase H-like HicB family nuclease